MPSTDNRSTEQGAARRTAARARPARRNRPLRRLADFLLIAGALVLSYPFWSSGYTVLHHGKLETEYTKNASSFAPLAASLATVQHEASARVRAKHLARAYRRTLHPGQPIGRLRIPRLKIDQLILEGERTTTLDAATDVWLLRKGPVHYAITPLPGEGEPFAVAGHRTTYGAPFSKLGTLRRGDRMTMETPYARFTYTVAKTTVVLPTDTSVLRDRGYALVLTTCTPPYSASHRLIIWATLTKTTLPSIPS